MTSIERIKDLPGAASYDGEVSRSLVPRPWSHDMEENEEQRHGSGSSTIIAPLEERTRNVRQLRLSSFTIAPDDAAR